MPRNKEFDRYGFARKPMWGTYTKHEFEEYKKRLIGRKIVSIEFIEGIDVDILLDNDETIHVRYS